MAKRRELTEKELFWAENLKRIWLRKKDELGLSQLSAALALGYKTQSAFSQYVNGAIPLNTDAKMAIGKLLEVDVVEIDPDFYADLPVAPIANDASEIVRIFESLPSDAARAQVIGFAKGLAAGSAGKDVGHAAPVNTLVVTHAPGVEQASAEHDRSMKIDQLTHDAEHHVSKVKSFAQKQADDRKAERERKKREKDHAAGAAAKK